jgi:hypothetical protein
MQRRSLRILIGIVEEGQRQGTIREDVDPEQVAWEWLMFVWAETMACLIGLTEFFEYNRSRPLLDSIIERAAASADWASLGRSEEVVEAQQTTSEGCPVKDRGSDSAG